MKLTASIIASALMCISPLALANHDPDAVRTGSSEMDTNGDGMISQEEFMAHQRAVWARMPKNKDGMVMVKDMRMHHDKMMSDKNTSMQGNDMDDQSKQNEVKKTDNGGQ
jgi:Ca2+-binding EF-hand superfamily protein